MENIKKTQLVVGKVVKAFAKFSDAHPDIWKDEHWDVTYGLVEAMADLIALVAGGGDPNPVINSIMEKCGRK